MQVPFPGIGVPQVLVWAKPAVTTTLETVSGEPPVLVTVTVWGALVVPIAWLLKVQTGGIHGRGGGRARAREGNRLRTCGYPIVVVGDGQCAAPASCSGGSECNANRTGGSHSQGACAGVRLGEIPGSRNARNLQSRIAGVLQRDVLRGAGRPDDLVGKAQALRPEHAYGANACTIQCNRLITRKTAFTDGQAAPSVKRSDRVECHAESARSFRRDGGARARDRVVRSRRDLSGSEGGSPGVCQSHSLWVAGGTDRQAAEIQTPARQARHRAVRIQVHARAIASDDQVRYACIPKVTRGEQASHCRVRARGGLEGTVTIPKQKIQDIHRTTYHRNVWYAVVVKVTYFHIAGPVARRVSHGGLESAIFIVQ